MTTAQATDARLAITAALTAAGLPAFSYVPKTVSMPAVIVIPDDPYLTPNRVGSQLSMEIAFVVACVANGNDNEAAVAVCEALAEAVVVSLPDGVRAVRVSRPSLDSIGAQGSVYVAEVTVQAQVQSDATIPSIPGGTGTGSGTGTGTGTGTGSGTGTNTPPTSITDGRVHALDIDLTGISASMGYAQWRVWAERNLVTGTPGWFYMRLAQGTRPEYNAESVSLTTMKRHVFDDKPPILAVLVDDAHYADGIPMGRLFYNGVQVTGVELVEWIENETILHITADLTTTPFVTYTITDIHNPAPPTTTP
jgi:hypothetical protein